MGESSGCKIMTERQVQDKLYSVLDEFIEVRKTASEIDIKGTMEYKATDSLLPHDTELNEHINDEMNEMNESSEQFADNMNISREITENFSFESASSMVSDEVGINKEWLHEDSFTSQHEGEEEEIRESEKISGAIGFDENSDEETIATFITSTGQQLALYAVEDSEEVFAVAVYSESGEPPTNFQFLMKADVERLIGEGAVRTVKKPQQMRKQTYQGELMTSRDKEMYLRSLENSSKSPQAIHQRTKKHIRQRNTNALYEGFEQSETVSPLQEAVEILTEVTEDEEEELNSINDDLTYQDILDNSHFLLEQQSKKKYQSELVSSTLSETKDLSIVEQTGDDIAEKSTVQYILYGEDQSDSELTFDEIQKSLQHFNKNKTTKASLREPIKDETSFPAKTNSQGFMSSPSKPLMDNVQTPNKIPAELSGRRVLQASTVKHKYVPNALLGRRNSNTESKKTVFIQGSATLICCTATDTESILQTNCKDSQDFSSKIKRSRKQQLTIVNRADSEIIIQPASMVSEDEEERLTKKKGRRKKRRQNNFKGTIRSKGPFSKRVSSNVQQPRIEVIEIDIDNDVEAGKNNEEKDGVKYGQRRNNIEEIITIEDVKEKYSSDKENEVIMVGDSDNEESETIKGKDEEVVVLEMHKKSNAAILKCDHCNRSFRQKRALDTHLRVCSQSPSARSRFSTSRSGSTRSNELTRAVLKKQYVCKICQEKFDVVVALARHVRSHYKKNETVASLAGTSQLKKKQGSTDKSEITMSTAVIADENIIQRRSTHDQKSKERLNVHRGWKSKKMSCIDCGRWFASVALLSAHSLQHATKKSEKRIKRCQICKKLFRSRPIYIRHMRMHSNAKPLQKRIKRTLQSTSTTTLRKRGRPRKM